MSYIRELDSIRPELRKGVAGTLSVFARVDGALTTATSGTFQVHGDAGEVLQGTTAVTVTAVSGVSRLDCAVGAISEYHDGARLEITWTPTAGAVRFDAVLFDVVRHPWTRSQTVTLNDLRETRPDVDDVLDRIGIRLGYATGQVAQETAAAVFAERARAELDAWIRASSASLAKPRPALIVDRLALHRVELSLALSLLYASLAVDPTEGTDEPSALSRYYRGVADAAYRQIPLVYDVDEDGRPETVSAKPGVVMTTRSFGASIVPTAQ